MGKYPTQATPETNLSFFRKAAILLPNTGFANRALCFRSLPLSPQMHHPFAGDRIDEAMLIDRAPTSVRVCQNSQALETEPDTAMAAKHLVALLSLVALVLEVLLR